MEKVMNERRQDFDAYEVHPCIHLGEGRYEQIGDWNDPNISLWSVYGHKEGEGLECLGDLYFREDAEILCKSLNEVLKTKKAAKPSEKEWDSRFRNYYHCPRCGCDWTDEWDCQCDDTCPECSKRHISPYESEDIAGK